MFNLRSTLCLLSALAVFSTASAETPEEKGLAIAIEADKRDTGWLDQTANMRMILKNKQGQKSEREIRVKTLEVLGDGDKSLTLFDTPRDVKNTAFLSFTHALKADDQWLYLPALKRVKRISSSNKSGPFMGSEFSFEDMNSQEVAKYSYKWLKDETITDHNCFVIERIPNYEHSGYTRQTVWMDKIMYQPIKVDFYDRKNTLIKTLTLHEQQQFLEQYWRPGRMEMINHQSGKSTTLQWSDYQFKTGLTTRDFDKNALKRAR